MKVDYDENILEEILDVDPIQDVLNKDKEEDLFNFDEIVIDEEVEDEAKIDKAPKGK